MRSLLVPSLAALLACSASSPPSPPHTPAPSAQRAIAPDSASSLAASRGSARAPSPLTLLRARCVEYAPAREFYRGTQALRASRGLELDVTLAPPGLADELFARDVTPQLYVGEVPVADDARSVDGALRFTSFSPEAVPVGGALSLRWPDARGVYLASEARYEGCVGP